MREADGCNPVVHPTVGREPGRRTELVDLYCRVGVCNPDVVATLEDLGVGDGDLAQQGL